MGIDAEAHRGALEAGGKTVAVVGCGPDVIYPQANEELYRGILEKGAVISEFAFGTRPSGENLRQRNRTIVAFAENITVVQCSKKSGAMIAARFAAQQKKSIFSFRYSSEVDNSGCDWLIDKSLAREIVVPFNLDLFKEVKPNLSPGSQSVDTLFREIWPDRGNTKNQIKPQSATRSINKMNMKKKSGKLIKTKNSINNQASLSLYPEPIQETTNTSSFKLGDNVEHLTLGKGVILNIVNAKSDTEITIQFGKRNIKRFSSRFANLRKI